MKLYQVKHDNCEPYGDNHHFREDKVYTNKENLIKSILDKGYEEVKVFRDEVGYIKHLDFFMDDMITIHEIEIIDNRGDIQ